MFPEAISLLAMLRQLGLLHPPVRFDEIDQILHPQAGAFHRMDEASKPAPFPCPDTKFHLAPSDVVAPRVFVRSTT